MESDTPMTDFLNDDNFAMNPGSDENSLPSNPTLHNMDQLPPTVRNVKVECCIK